MKRQPILAILLLMKVKKENLAEAWKKALNIDPPAEIMQAPGQLVFFL